MKYPSIQKPEGISAIRAAELDYADNKKDIIWRETDFDTYQKTRKAAFEQKEKANCFFAYLLPDEKIGGFYLTLAEFEYRYFVKVCHSATAEFEVSRLRDKLQLAKLHELTGNVLKSFNRNGSLIDCTNRGASSRHNVMAYVTEGDERLSDPDFITRDDVLVIVNHQYGMRAIPVRLHFSGAWAMFGGNFIYDCDSRFPNTGSEKTAIKIFDRVE